MALKYTLRIPAFVFSGVKLPGLEAHRSSAFNVDIKMGGSSNKTAMVSPGAKPRGPK